MTTVWAEAELLAEGEELLARREDIERAIARGFRNTAVALAVHVAQLERQRDRVRAELLRIVAAADEAAGREEAEDEAAPEGEAPEGGEDFYSARERLAADDRELVARIEAVQQRARRLPQAATPPALADLEHQREQIEGQLRQWRARCRRAGVAPTLPRWHEYAAGSID